MTMAARRLGFVPALALAALLAPAAAAQQGQRPVLLVSDARIDGDELHATVDASLPAGSRVEVRLMRRGSRIAGTRVVLSEGHAQVLLPLPPRIPPTFYDVSAVWLPEPSVAGLPLAAERPLEAVISVLRGTREEILLRRDDERTFYRELLKDLRTQFASFAADLDRVARKGEDPDDPEVRAAFASSLALVSSFRNGLLDREPRHGPPVLEEAHFLAVELIGYVAALHHEVMPRKAAYGPAEAAPLVLEDDAPAQALLGFQARAGALEQALLWDRNLGHADLVVHVVRTVERLRRQLALARSQSQESLKTAETGWRTLAGQLAEELKGVEDDSRILTATSVDMSRHPALDGLPRLAADLRVLWRELEAALAGRAVGKTFDERERQIREEVRKLVDALRLDWIRTD